MKDLTIGIVGGGVVGSATANAYRGFVKEVRIYDVLGYLRTHCLADVAHSNIVFLCLPTPQRKDGLGLDTSAIDGFFSAFMLAFDQVPPPWDRDTWGQINWVLRSTAPIGYTRKLAERLGLKNLVHSPEFLTARAADHDAANPTRNIVGTPNGRDSLDQKSCTHALRNLYADRWPDVLIHRMTSDESEAVKLFQNAFSAVKISVFNELRSLADKLGLDWAAVLKALLAGGWINPMHTEVPGRTGWGFDGGCLPKDLGEVVRTIQESGSLHLLDGRQARLVGYGTASSVCKAAMERNAVDLGRNL